MSVPLTLRLVLSAVAALIALAIVVTGAFALLDEASVKTSIVRTSYANVRALEVEDDVGAIQLTGAPAGDRLRVVEHVRRGLRGPQRHAERSGDGTLRLSAACPDFPGGSCGVRFEIVVPAGTSVTAHSGAGSVRARGLAGARRVRLDSGAGSVRIEGAQTASLELTSAAGDVRATGVRSGRVRVESSAGSVRATLLQPARSLFAHSAAGDVDLTVPDVTYAVEASSSAGDVSDGSLHIDPDAPRSISATSAAGDVHIGVPGG